MKITEQIRDGLISSLPKNYARLVAETTRVSESTVYRVLHHEQENELVAEALIQLAEDTREKHKRLARKAKQLSAKTAA